MKIQVILVALIGVTGLSAAEMNKGDAFLEFRSAAAAQPFGIVQAETLADVQRMALVGACGMVVFKEKRGPVWTFESKVGYSGTSGPEISIVEPPATVPNFGTSEKDPIQSPKPTPAAGMSAVEQPLVPAAGVVVSRQRIE